MDEHETLYETDEVRFYIDKSVPCLVNEWRGYIKSETFRAAILKLVELLEAHRAHYPTLNLLADTRTLGVLQRQDLAWVAEEINPRYVAAGATHEAFVLSEDEFGKLSVKRYMVNTTSQGDFTVNMFDSMEKAKAWLREVAQ